MPAQARAALRKYKDVMQAAERIFEGEFEDVMDDAEESSAVGRSVAVESRPRMIVSVVITVMVTSSS